MDELLFKRILTRVVIVPVVALLLLAALLGEGLRGYRLNADRVDRTDRAVAQVNHVTNLMVDEETGSRGFLLTHQQRFLEPLQAARSVMDAELPKLRALVADNPAQVQNLKQIEIGYREFRQITDQLIRQPDSGQDVTLLTSRQKDLMDKSRRELKELQAQESSLRTSRSRRAQIFEGWTFPLLALAIALAALLITRFTWLNFRQANRAFLDQVSEIRAQGNQIYEREQWLKTTLRSIGDGVVVCDHEGRIDFMNPVAEQLTGWSEAEANGKSLPDVFHILNEYTREIVESPVDKVRRLGVIVGLANHTVLIRKDKTELSIDDSGAPVRNAAGELMGVVLVFRDNHNKRMAEHALIRAEKLAAAGRLAATIAHEVNNPLEAIVNLIYLGQHEKDLGEIRRILKLADSEVHRIAHITRQSLGFYRESVAPASFQPADLVEEIVAFYGGQANRLNIHIETTLKTKCSIVGARGELRQVLSNLIANSIDAVGTNGRILIAVRDTHQPGTGLLKGVRIAVADSGKGIPAELKDKIFEPFFTTKADVGTGLGLWVSRELIEKQGGKLLMRSRPGIGTLFTISLPVSEDGETNREIASNGHSPQHTSVTAE